MRVLLIDVPQLLDSSLGSMLGQHDVMRFRGDTTDVATTVAAAECDVVIQGYGCAGDLDEMVMRATFGTWNVLTSTRARRYVQLTTMRVFDAYDPGWAIDEEWLPRPTTAANQLIPQLAELTSREISRTRDLEVAVLRLDEVSQVLGDPTSVSVSDAARAITRAVELDWSSDRAGRWRPFHIVAGTGRYPVGRAALPPFGFTPVEACPAHQSPDSQREPAWPAVPEPLTNLAAPRRVVIFGAGGPLGAAAYDALADEHELLASDLRPLAELATRPLQSEHAPRLTAVASPHAEHVADVTDLDAVLEVAAEADALVNLTVVRAEAPAAFGVNVLGTYHVMVAAVRHGIGRVVHTGPAQVLHPHPVGQLEDRLVPDDTPAHAGERLYFLTKLLAQEICRVFALEHRLACPVLLYCTLSDPVRDKGRLEPFAVSWADAGRAVAAAVRVEGLPEPSPVLHILVPSPHDRYRSGKATAVLGWRPQDRLDQFWWRERPTADPAKGTARHRLEPTGLTDKG